MHTVRPPIEARNWFTDTVSIMARYAPFGFANGRNLRGRKFRQCAIPGFDGKAVGALDEKRIRSRYSSHGTYSCRMGIRPGPA
jgi:hypothetical protein